MSNRRDSRSGRLARVFRALASPNRIALLRLLSEGCCEGRGCCTAEELSLCVESLAARLGVVKSTVSHHLKALAAAGIIELARRGRHNDFRLNREALARVSAFLEQVAGRGAGTRRGAARLGKKRGRG
jgi:DNA-binding transcriptional ArsR family regulator